MPHILGEIQVAAFNSVISEGCNYCFKYSQLKVTYHFLDICRNSICYAYWAGRFPLNTHDARFTLPTTYSACIVMNCRGADLKVPSTYISWTFYKKWSSMSSTTLLLCWCSNTTGTACLSKFEQKLHWILRGMGVHCPAFTRCNADIKLSKSAMFGGFKPTAPAFWYYLLTPWSYTTFTALVGQMISTSFICCIIWFRSTRSLSWLWLWYGRCIHMVLCVAIFFPDKEKTWQELQLWVDALIFNWNYPCSQTFHWKRIGVPYTKFRYWLFLHLLLIQICPLCRDFYGSTCFWPQ